MRSNKEILESLVKSYNQKEGINFIDLRDVENVFNQTEELLFRLKQLLSMSEDAPILYKKQVKDLAQKAIEKATK